MTAIAAPPIDLPVRAGTRSLSVLERVRNDILDGTVAASERMNEVQLSKRLDVSRTPVRAALQALAGEGLLDYSPNRGFTVREFPLSAIVGAFEIRASLEGLAARLAAERGFNPNEHAVMEASLVAGDELLSHATLSETDLLAYRDINADFHQTLISAADNRMLAEMVRNCQNVPSSSARNIVAFEHREVRRRHDDHHRIYEAIKARESWRAEMLMREHVIDIRNSFSRSIRR
ncbi:GntR family transcriptional regulator [Tardiphaga sp. 866_E4_N2_1]|uniref:GntR family transcriptional regulator n=1 Tax=unclassified Tardiphaga TaxID=2631404 RepID=UPI003F27D4D9